MLPQRRAPDFDAELAALAQLPADLVAFEFLRAFWDHAGERDPALLRNPTVREHVARRVGASGGDRDLALLLFDDPAELRERFLALLEDYRDEHFGAEWGMLEHELAGAVAEAEERLTADGLYPLLETFGRRLVVDRERGEFGIDLPHFHRVPVTDEAPLHLVPSAFVWPGVRVNCDAPFPLTIVYPAPFVARRARSAAPDPELLRLLRALADDTRLRSGRCQDTANLLQNGKVLVAGGSYSVNADLYDPANRTWTPTTGPMHTTRFFHSSATRATAACLSQAATMIRMVLNLAQVYDPGTNSWSVTGSMSTVRLQSTTTTLNDGRVLVAGAYTQVGVLPVSEIYDPGTGTWSPTASMNVARAAYSAVLLPNGNVLVAVDLDSDTYYLADAEVYDPTAGTWTSTSPMSTFRSGHTGTLLQNGTVLVTGGFDGAAYVSSTETYDPATETWSGDSSLAPRDTISRRPQRGWKQCLEMNDQPLSSLHPGTRASTLYDYHHPGGKLPLFLANVSEAAMILGSRRRKLRPAAGMTQKSASYVLQTFDRWA